MEASNTIFIKSQVLSEIEDVVRLLEVNDFFTFMGKSANRC